MNIEKKSATFVLALSLIISLSVNVHAQAGGDDGPGIPGRGKEPSMNPVISVSGCTSQGTWTAEALRVSQEIGRVVGMLSDAPECKGFKDQFLALSEKVQGSLTDVQPRPDDPASQLATIPSEIKNFSSFLKTATGEERSLGLKLLTQKLFHVGDLTSSLSGASASVGTTVEKIVAPVAERLERSTSLGLDMVDFIAANASKRQQCMMGLPDDGVTTILSGALQLTNAYAGTSSKSMATRLAKSVNSLSQVLKDQKFATVLKRTRKQQFWTSISCLVESTAESWCTTQDALTLFNDSVDRMKFRTESAATSTNKFKNNANQLSVRSDNPLQGFYILVNQIPMITAWIQKVQIGVDPRLSPDANFQNAVLDTMNEHVKRIKRIQAIYQAGLKTISEFSDSKSKSNELLNMIEGITDQINDQRTGRNFFSTIIPDPELTPFLILGKSSIPGIAGAQDRRDYMQAGGWRNWIVDNGNYSRFREIKDSGEDVANKMGSVLNNMFEDANRQAIQYFTTWFVVDQPSLVNDSMTQIGGVSVVESFINVDRYLSDLYQRVLDNGGQTQVLASIDETQARIRRVLVAYDDLKQMGLDSQSLKARAAQLKLAKKAGTLSSATNDKYIQDYLDYLLKTARAYKKVTDVVYEQFNILVQKANFFPVRVGTLVRYDYALLVRSGKDLTKYEDEIMKASRQGVIDRFLEFFTKNPQAVLADLQKADQIGRENINALEMLFRDSLVAYMAEFNLVAKNLEPDEDMIAADSYYRLLKDSNLPAINTKTGKRNWTGPTQAHKDNKKLFSSPFWNAMFTLIMPPVISLRAITRSVLYPDMYPMLYPWQQSTHMYVQTKDSRMRSTEQNLAGLCIQTLAFEDASPFYEFCKDKVSVSFTNMPAYVKTGTVPKSSLNASYLELLNSQDSDDDSGERMKRCGYRDFLRRNHIVNLNTLVGEVESEMDTDEIDLTREIESYAEALRAVEAKARMQAAEQAEKIKAEVERDDSAQARPRPNPY